MLNAALKVLSIIEDNSYEAYIVGGFVRDYIMGIKSNDVDVTTNATPKELIKIFPNANIEMCIRDRNRSIPKIGKWL